MSTIRHADTVEVILKDQRRRLWNGRISQRAAPRIAAWQQAGAVTHGGPIST